MKPILETKRLMLFKPTEEDYAFMRELLISEISSRNKKDPYTLEQVDATVNRTRNHWIEHGFGTCVGVYKPTGERIGFGGPKYIKVGDEFILDIGAFIKKSHQGLGLAAETFPVCLDYVFNQMKLDTVATVIDPEKPQIVHLLEKLGYRYIKTMDYELDGIKFSGQAYYEMSKEDYLNLYQK